MFTKEEKQNSREFGKIPNEVRVPCWRNKDSVKAWQIIFKCTKPVNLIEGMYSNYSGQNMVYVKIISRQILLH